MIAISLRASSAPACPPSHLAPLLISLADLALLQEWALVLCRLQCHLSNITTLDLVFLLPTLPCTTRLTFLHNITDLTVPSLFILSHMLRNGSCTVQPWCAAEARSRPHHQVPRPYVAPEDHGCDDNGGTLLPVYRGLARGRRSGSYKMSMPPLDARSLSG